jgi:hypothetical protein
MPARVEQHRDYPLDNVTPMSLVRIGRSPRWDALPPHLPPICQHGVEGRDRRPVPNGRKSVSVSPDQQTPVRTANQACPSPTAAGVVTVFPERDDGVNRQHAQGSGAGDMLAGSAIGPIPGG